MMNNSAAYTYMLAIFLLHKSFFISFSYILTRYRDLSLFSNKFSGFLSFSSWMFNFIKKRISLYEFDGISMRFPACTGSAIEKSSFTSGLGILYQMLWYFIYMYFSLPLQKPWIHIVVTFALYFTLLHILRLYSCNGAASIRV